jgi:outer membrane protein
MKKRMLSAALLAAALAPAAAPAAPKASRICVLDQSALLARSSLALAEAARFQQLRQTAQANFDKDNRALEADARALENFKRDLPPATLQARAQDLAQRRADLARRGEQVNRDLAKLDETVTANVMRAATPTIQAVERESGCGLLIARSALLDLPDTSLDITPKVIDRMNAASAAQ